MSIHHLADDDQDETEGQIREFRNAKAYIAVISALTDTKWQTAQEILNTLRASGIKRDIRWLQMVLKALAEGDASIERDQSSRPYRFRKLRGQDPLSGDAKIASEALTLLLAKAHLQDLLPPGVLEWMDASFRRAEQALAPGGRAKPYNSWPDKVAVVGQLPKMLAPAIDEECLKRVGHALLNDHLLSIDYRNANGRVLENRNVMPLALVRQGKRLFLVCRFGEHTDVRNLALHRMLRVEVTSHPFTRPDDFDLSTYIDNGGFGFGNGVRIRLVMRVAPHLAALLRETPLSDDQTFSDPTDLGEQVAATVVKGEQIRWWIRMQGKAVQQIVSPADLMTTEDSGHPARTEPL